MTGWIVLILGAGALLGFTWVGYPFLAIALGERRPVRPPVSTGGHPLVSVVLATRDGVAPVQKRVRNLLDARWPEGHLEVVVALDGVQDHYEEITAGGNGGVVRITTAPLPGGKALALNAGVAAARGEVLVFADTAQRFNRETIRLLVEALADPALAAVSGSLRLADEQESESPVTRYWRLERRLRAAEARIHSTIGVSGAVWAMRRSCWKPLPAGLLLDDLWTPLRLVLEGHRVGFVEAEAHDPRATTPEQEFRRKTRTLSGNFQLLAWMPAVLVPWRNPVWLQFVCHKVLRLLTPVALLAMALGFAAIVLALASPAHTWVAVTLTALMILLAAVAPGGLARRARKAAAWVVVMQVAIVVAGWNGLRGRWNVWGN